MRRRTVLQTTGLALMGASGGCLSNTGDPNQSDTSPDDGQGTTGDANWPMVHADAANTAYHPTTTGPTDPVSEQWQFTASGKFETQPTVVDGIVYATTGGGGIYAIDERDGTEVWQFDTGRQELGAPAVAEGLVHAVASGHLIHTLDAATGERQWQFEMGSKQMDWVRSSLTVANGTLYVGGTDGKVYALDSKTGTEQWQYETQDRLHLTPAVVDDSVYIATHLEGRLAALNATDGTERWRHIPEKGKRTISIYGDPTVSNGSVYIGISADDPNVTHSATGRIDALGADDGTVQWQVDTENPVGNTATDGRTLYIETHSPSQVPQGSVLAVDASDGAERWRRDPEKHVYVWTAVVDGQLYAMTSDSNDDPAHFRAIQTDDGTEHWAYELDEPHPSEAAVVNGTAFVTEPSTMYALE